ncbi:PHD finger protein 7-like, partial [Neopelma chrysocephalum]|uniref:PHD finger protein 7-like n=1 Tax=Neopelma chrysocephalum TaxID=114329 RepID=UPI000FCD21A7
MSDSEEEEEAPEEREPACLLCQQADADPDICGEKHYINGLCVHRFCLFFANHLPHRPVTRRQIRLVPPRDIQDEVSRAAQQRCCVCGQSGATITCCETGCDLSFHLPCAKEGGCVTKFVMRYRGFCPAHRPQQEVKVTPEPGTQCLICMEPVEDRQTFNTLVCPACKSAWFHRDCIQGHALHAGAFAFWCPLCRNVRGFLRDMFIMGIRIPFRPPSWEGNDAFAEQRERHRRCDASECLCPGGRQEAEQEGPWQLLRCSSCAAEGTHRQCSGLRNSITRWECDGCAGLGTSSGDDSRLAGVCVVRLSGLEVSDSSREPETISPNTGSLVLPGLSPSSPALETISPSTGAQIPHVQSRGPQDRSHVPAPSPGRRRRRQRPSQTSRRRNRSRRQHRTPNPSGRSRSPHDRSHVRAPSAGSRTPNQEASGTSRRRNRSRRQ